MKRKWVISKSANNQFKLRVHAKSGGKTEATFGETYIHRSYAMKKATSLSKQKEMITISNLVAAAMKAIDESRTTEVRGLMVLIKQYVEANLDTVVFEGEK